MKRIFLSLQPIQRALSEGDGEDRISQPDFNGLKEKTPGVFTPGMQTLFVMPIPCINDLLSIGVRHIFIVVEFLRIETTTPGDGS